MEGIEKIKGKIIIGVIIFFCLGLLFLYKSCEKTTEEKLLNPQIKQLENQIKTAEQIIKAKDERIKELEKNLIAIEKKRMIRKQGIKSKTGDALAKELTRQGF